MRGSRLHPTSPSLLWLILHFINGASVAAQQTQNITVPVTSSQIIYTPFVCNASIALADSKLCSGAWRLASSNNSVSTTGSTSSSGNILPQLFFEFQASHLSINALPSSNASVNISISADGRHISNVFKSSDGAVSIVGLLQNETTFLTMTYIPSTEPTLFGLESFVITVPQNAPTSAFFPTPTLPSSSSISIPASTTTSTSTSSSSAITTVQDNVISKKTMVAEGVGITIGLGVGLTAIAVALFYYWKRRKQRLEDVGIEEAKSEWSREGSFRPSFRLTRAFLDM